MAGRSPGPSWKAFQRWLWRCQKPNGQRLGWSTQREHLSSLKDWFRWLTRQNVLLPTQPASWSCPARKRLHQEVLTLAEVNRLVAVPDVADPLGVRDRAILELFYSCGLRRTELCRLELSSFHAERRTLHVRGKGNKDRMVPVGWRAVQWLERYLTEIRPRLCLDTRTQALFLTGYGDAFNPDVLSRMVIGLAGTGRTQAQGLLPHPAAHLRHAHAGKRGRHSLHPAVARTREAGHDGDLHRSLDQTVAGSPCPLPSHGPACPAGASKQRRAGNHAHKPGQRGKRGFQWV